MLSYQETESCQEIRAVNAVIFCCSAKSCLKSWKTNLSLYEITFIT